MYDTEPKKLFSTGDARRSSGGHGPWRNAVLQSVERWWETARTTASILQDPATTPASWYTRFRKEVLKALPCFGPYWGKYVFGDISEHLATEKGSLHDFTMIGPGCEYWLRFMGLRMQDVQKDGLAAVRELRDVVNKVLESGVHEGLERARVEARLMPLTAYDIQVLACECKRGFKMPGRIKKQRRELIFE